ncbi:DUF1839 family protein [Rhizobium sp. KVB221]|uniref:DUF1839 family protein n=1 Tax=Rhizobium setariae TaxID=2801340 RepID=A0A937CIY1_9HYPH|nr:DUF1839 family protein [Rhizobium setariae]MBL0370535.1 DUF1839 family protein [Rhizobium setariae]
MTTAVFPLLDPRDYQPHRLHNPERIWPETNCYVDLWIEVLNARGLAPEAMLGFTVTQDFEGDQFTFFKVPLDDLETLYDIRVMELAIFDKVEAHVAEQIGRGRLCLVEMDSFYMPDTQGVAYRTEHGKTTVGINRISERDKEIDYFHNGGFFQLKGEDFDGLLGRLYPAGGPPFLPYTEFAKFPDRPLDQSQLRTSAETLLERHIRRMPKENPVAAFARHFPEQAQALAERPFEYFHKYAFNTLRQLGANFELAASHFQWLSPEGELTTAADAALQIATAAKTAQFQLARALTRKKFEPLATALDPAIEGWDQLAGILHSRIN